MSTPALSLVLASRNDDYMGNARWRLETSLNYVGERVEALGRETDVEVLVTDWGSDVPLSEVVALTPATARIVSFVTVPAVLARERQRDSPFPEVLALNAAARRARGTYIGRIDQDTLVGDRFLRWFFEVVERERPLKGLDVTLESALFFANRRGIPYSIASGSPSLRHVTRFIRLFGTTLHIWRDNPSTGDVFWTSAVGIWLAHRDLWHECGGYDERLIYYNWMEADMICRLRRKYPVVDLGALTGHDFYHLDHLHPRAARFGQRHAMKNRAIDLAAEPSVLHPNPDDWGLRDDELTFQRSRSSAGGIAASAVSDRVGETYAFALVLLRLTAATIADGVIIFCMIQYRIWGGRLRRVRRELAERPAVCWPREVWRLWSSRQRRT